MKHVHGNALLAGTLIIASCLVFACSSDDDPKPKPDTVMDSGTDGTKPDGPGADTHTDKGQTPDENVLEDRGPGAEQPTEADLSGSPDLASSADTGVTYTGSFPANPTPASFINVPFTIDGVARTATVYAPVGWKKKMPLIIACPSTDTNGEDGIWDVAANELADQEKMITISVVPTKKSAGDWDQHVAGEAYFATYPNESFATNNDLKFVVAVIAEAQRAYAIDPQRVYTTGYSNGAFFAQFAAFHLPNRIAGFAAAGGGLVKCADTFDCTFNGSAATTPTCAALAKLPKWCNCTGPDKPGAIPTTGRKPAGYFFHAANDDVVSVYYDCQLETRLKSLGYPAKLDLRLKGGHNAPAHFMVDAWKWLKTYTLP